MKDLEGESGRLIRQASADVVFLRKLSLKKRDGEGEDYFSPFCTIRSRSVSQYHGDDINYAAYRQNYLKLYSPFADQKRKTNKCFIFKYSKQDKPQTSSPSPRPASSFLHTLVRLFRRALSLLMSQKPL
ncbi:uncharacterized protein G2W53_019969 [Senna tora]|uniref:Uncharacterized protein n=1 Tax=Senna tora TaxID=362788 RepID=A0A834TZA8_9FABA|nr:uncharacterized protein G2W53_019969 [Senna tora]